MAWTALTSPMFTVGQIVTAAQMNALSDNLRYLKGTDGPFYVDNNMGIGTGAPPSTNLQVLGSIRAGNAASALAGGQRAITIRSLGDTCAFSMEASGTSGRAWGFFSVDASSTTSVLGAVGSFTVFDQTANLPALTLNASRQLGIGTIAPQTKLHLYDTNGGSCFVTLNDVLSGATPQVAGIIPDGAGDCVYGLRCQSVVRCSTGAAQGNSVTVIATGALVGTNIYDDGTSVCSIQIAANGAIQVSKTAGVAGTTFKIALWITWL